MVAVSLFLASKAAGGLSSLKGAPSLGNSGLGSLKGVPPLPGMNNNNRGKRSKKDLIKLNFYEFFYMSYFSAAKTIVFILQSLLSHQTGRTLLISIAR